MANPIAEGRMIRREISNSDRFATLTPEAAVLFVMIIPWFNAHGKLNGGAGFIKDEICPKIQYLTYENIPVLLQEISDKTNVKWFKVDGRYWLHSIHFNTEHQRLDKRGVDKLPSYSPVLVDDLSLTSQNQVPPEIEEEIEVEDEKDATAPPFVLPSKEEIHESSEPKILESIKTVCQQLYQENIFPEVNAFKNKMVKNKKNNRSILHVLTRCYLSKPNDPWAFCQKIIELENLNYNERDNCKTAK